MSQIIGQAHKVCVLDHHKTAQAELDFPSCSAEEFKTPNGRIHIHFDMAKSGGRLTWELFFPGQPAPWLVDYTEDRDLWTWKLDWTKEVNAWLRSTPLTFENWDKIALVEPGCEAWDMRVDAGTAILRNENNLVDQHVRFAAEIEIDGHKVLSVNATCLNSEIGQKLATGRPFSVTWFEAADGNRVYSLRSDENGIDVSEIAKKHGGGGHKNAAGFSVPATGATGLFTQGKVNPTDEGELRFAIAADKKAGLVRIDFGTPTAWLGFPKDQAMQLAGLIIKNANKLA